MKYLHTMVRVSDPAHSLAFYRDVPGREVLGIRAFVTVPGAWPSARRQNTSPARIKVPYESGADTAVWSMNRLD